MLVTSMSGKAVWLKSPCGVIVVMPPFRIVATQTLPAAVMARLSKYCRPGIVATTRPPLKGDAGLLSPGEARSKAHIRPVIVSAMKTVCSSGDRPTPLGEE